MKYLPILMLLLISCTQRTRVTGISLEQYKEAMLRSRTVYQRDMNLDLNNDITISYDVLFYDQLVELNFEVMSANTSVETVVNGGYATKGDKSLEELKVYFDMILGHKFQLTPFKERSISDLKIYLDGADATSCIVAMCNDTDCDGNQTSESAIASGYKTSRIYLNLNKMGGYAECSGHDLRAVGAHSITFKEVGSTVGRVLSQLIVYNRTFDPQNIKLMYQ